ncbi:MAG: hypothetical protein QF664_06730 [Dehalococcoidia bacterium]|nr:hypothetical protein [Dehalococcoidia bacterium]
MTGSPPTRAHPPRPIDLVALVAFDDAVCENQAVTRERLARPAAAPHALGAAIEQWLVRRRHMWIDVRDRQINGIATARTLSADDAWVIDTLVDASETLDRAHSSAGGNGAVIDALLEQALQAATQNGVTRVLLRVPADAAVLLHALRSGFQPALRERLWSGDGLRAGDCAPGRDRSPAGERSPEGIEVRDAGDSDGFELFQLYNRALPIDARQAMALTFVEWEGIQERRWLGRNAREWVAEQDGRLSASLRLSLAGDFAQFDLIASGGANNGGGTAAAVALLDVAAAQIEGRPRVLTLAPRLAGPVEGLLAARGLAPGNEYALLSRRTAKPLPERARLNPEVVVSRGV